MINQNETFEVKRTELHALAVCPCFDCSQERERRAVSDPSPVKLLNPTAAYALGFISHLNPFGSLARQVGQQEDAADGMCVSP